MEKLILLAGILITGAISANTISTKYENDKKSEIKEESFLRGKKEVVSKDKDKTILKNKATKEYNVELYSQLVRQHTLVRIGFLNSGMTGVYRYKVIIV